MHFFAPGTGESLFRFLVGDIRFAELLVRCAIALLVCYVSIWLVGKNFHQRSTPLDHAITIILGSLAGNFMLNYAVSVSEFAIAVAVLTGAVRAFTWWQFRSDRSADIANGRATLIVQDGACIPEALAKEKVSDEQLRSALRRKGFVSTSDVGRAYVELNGEISAFSRDEVAQCAHPDLLRDENIDVIPPS